MDYKVGSKGQIVIDHDIREALGIGPGWLAAQRLVDDHLEIRFFPPEHNRSLLGILADPTKPSISMEDWPEARERMWEEVVAEKENRVRAQLKSRARAAKGRRKS